MTNRRIIAPPTTTTTPLLLFLLLFLTMIIQGVGISGLVKVQDQLELEDRISREVLSDFLLIRSGLQCGRCIALETLMENLQRFISMPVFLIRSSKPLQTPGLELHKLQPEEAGGSAARPGYEKILYDGPMSSSGILRFLQDVTSARRSSQLDHPLKDRSVETVEEAVDRSKKTGGRVPFICEVVEGSEDIAFFEKVIKEAGLENAADFYYITKKPAVEIEGGKERGGRLMTVAHPFEMRLTLPVDSSDSADQVVRWMRTERFAQFGELRYLTEREKEENKNWIVLIGGTDSFDLFQHEFREFASRNRDQWRAGWINKDSVELWEKSVENILNIAEDLSTFGRLIDEEGSVSWSCRPDCVIGRKQNVIKYMTTTNLSSNKIDEFARSFGNTAPQAGIGGGLDEGRRQASGGQSGGGQSGGGRESGDRQESRVADLKVEFERSRELGIVRLTSAGEFQQKVLMTADPVLLLLRAAEGERSVELRSVIESVADILLPSNRIKFYEMTDLPPPDSRYAAYTKIPHLWFKPVGVNENPLSIPWEENASAPSDERQTQARSKTAASSVIAAARSMISAAKEAFTSSTMTTSVRAAFTSLTRKGLSKLKSILDRLSSSLNYYDAPAEL